MVSDNLQESLQLIYSITRELVMAHDQRSVLPRILALSLENVSGERGSIIVLGENGQPVSSLFCHYPVRP
jgi:hypothetical protein